MPLTLKEFAQQLMNGTPPDPNAPLAPGTSVQLNPQTLGNVPEQPMVAQGPLKALQPLVEGIPEAVRGATVGTTDPNDSWAAKGATLAAAALPVATGVGALKGLWGDAESAGLVSRLRTAMEGLPAETSAARVLNIAKKSTSAEELNWHGLPDFLGGLGQGPVTRAAVLAKMDEKPMQLGLTTLGQSIPKADGEESLAPTKFSSYQVPGGTNYRENLITLPAKDDRDVLAKAHAAMAQDGVDPDTVDVNTYKDYVHRAQPIAPFRSSHFDQPNILVHTRTNDRTLPTGEPGRFLEEVQSDWHQKGKDEGYKQAIPHAAEDMPWTDYVKAQGLSGAEAVFGDMTNPIFARWLKRYEGAYDVAQANLKKPPDAPFKDSWPDLGLKQQLLEVAKDPKLQWMGFTDGQTQKDRYKLSNVVNRIDWQQHAASSAPEDALKTGGHLVALDTKKQGTMLLKVTEGKVVWADRDSASQELIGKSLESIVGKAPAKHILSNPTGTMSGDGLDLEGQGMLHFYDNLLPKRLDKIVKPFGGVVEKIPGSAYREEPAITADIKALQAKYYGYPGQYARGEAGMDFHDFSVQNAALQQERDMAGTRAPAFPGWMVRLTPEMKAKILKGGLPLMTGVAATEAAQPSADSPTAPLSFKAFTQQLLGR